MGDGIALIALVLYVKSRIGSGLAVGALLLAQSLPHLLGPLAGSLVDRLDLKRVMLTCELTQTVIYCLIAWLSVPFPALLLLVAAASVLDTTFSPASGSTVPAIVEPSDRLRANAWLDTALNLQVAVGPFLGGLLVATAGVRWALTANALSFLLSALFLLRLPDQVRGVSAAAGGVLSGGWDGLRYAWQEPVVRALIIGLFFVVAFAAIDNVALVFLARDVLHAGVFAYGAIAGAFGLGMLAASMLLSAARSEAQPGRMTLLGWLLTAVGNLLTGLAPTAPVAGLSQAVGGAGNGIDNVAASTLLQERVSPALLGRVIGISGTAAFAGSAVAYLLAGLLLAVTSARITFIVGGLGALLALVVFGPALWRARPLAAAA